MTNEHLKLCLEVAQRGSPVPAGDVVEIIQEAQRLRERLKRASQLFDASLTKIPNGLHLICLDDVLAIRALLTLDGANET